MTRDALECHCSFMAVLLERHSCLPLRERWRWSAGKCQWSPAGEEAAQAQTRPTMRGCVQSVHSRPMAAPGGGVRLVHPRTPNVRVNRRAEAGRLGPVGENVPRTANRAKVACRSASG
ncbi:MAG: hypothetical protein Q8J76_05710 [Desulfobulbaceae bacterium]|nr:hypothetical protein [Desulfobulbaceae bacterium]